MPEGATERNEREPGVHEKTERQRDRERERERYPAIVLLQRSFELSLRVVPLLARKMAAPTNKCLYCMTVLTYQVKCLYLMTAKLSGEIQRVRLD